MSRLIDADTLKKDIARLHVLNDEAEIRRTYEYNPHTTTTDFEETLVSVFDAIDEAPTIDIDLADDGTLSVEVDDATKVKRVLVEDGESGDLYYADRPQGEWKSMGDFERCSVCDSTHLKEFQSYYGKTIWIKTPYCPYCGAHMKGADDE